MLSLFSQEPFKGGISVGALSSQVDGDSYSGYDKSAVHAGIWVSRKIAPNFQLLVEMSYRPKGSKSSLNAKLDDLEYYKLTLHYIEVPVMVQYHYNQRLFFNLGAGFAYLVYDKQEGLVVGFLSTDKTGFNKYDFIGTIGVGYHIGEKWTASAHFTYSLIDTAKNYKAPAPELRYPKQYNNVMSLSLHRHIRF